ncbi:MAG: hypothetical protein SFU86_04705 [Pirellulaceae bacterium]|nr:hypothetical protein [Pirellulaceae bacterium]
MFRSTTTRCLVLAALALSLGCRAGAPSAPAATPPALPTSATAGNGTSIVAISPPAQQCCPKQTLPQFLGLTGLARGIAGLIGRIRNRLGSVWPGLEAKPEILAITDPANLESDNPAIAEAAAVKAQEDEAAQKAKAIAYLGTVGCAGCYPGVEDALLAALDDCTEEVRFAAVTALRQSGAGPCKNCKTTACCGPKIREKLEKMANDQDANGCYVEPSDRVRRVARLALCNCSLVPPKPPKQETRPAEGPDAAEGPPAEESPTVALLPPVEQSVLERRPGSTGPVGSGLNAAESAGTLPPTVRVAKPRPAGNRQVNYEEAIATYQARGGAAAMEVAWEEWTAKVDQFPSRQDAVAAMTIARTQAMSSGGTVSLPAIRKTTHDWTTADQIASPALARLVAQTQIGGVSGVIEDKTGLRMIRVTGRRPLAPPVAEVPAAATEPTPAAPVSRAAPRRTATAPGMVRLPPCDCER